MLITLSHLGLLQVTGPDAKKLLQGQLTCNLDEISPLACRLGAHCNPQGRILYAFRLFWYQDSYYLQMPLEVLPGALQALNKYAIFFKAKILDATDKLIRLAATAEELAPHFNPLPVAPDAVLTADNLLIARLPGDMFEILGDPAAIAALGLQATADNAHNRWKLSNILAGIPTIYAATAGKLLPHEINYPAINGVSFNKGCYTGQEIIARMHYRGQIKKHMHRAQVNTQHLPAAGLDVYLDGPDFGGTIIDSCQDENGYCQLLVLANISDVQSRKLYLDPDKIEPLEFIPLPY
jgi:folate-binding protein YgfZ